jgi:hypothetical protein
VFLLDVGDIEETDLVRLDDLVGNQKALRAIVDCCPVVPLLASLSVVRVSQDPIQSVWQ